MTQASDVWSILGVAKTCDPKAIRRAYVAKLRSIDMETEASAFMALRDAFDSALESAQEQACIIVNQAAFEATDDTFDLEGFDDLEDDNAVEVSISKAPSETSAERERRIEWQDDLCETAHRQSALRRALIDEEAVSAWEIYNRAMARGEISLDQQTSLALLVMEKIVDDKSLPQDVFMTIMRSLGLDDAPWRYEGRSTLTSEIKKRISAYYWLDGLRERAAQRVRGTQRFQIRGAQIFLRKRKWLGRHPSVLAPLEAIFSEYHVHEAWLGSELDGVWLQTLEGRVRRRIKLNRRNGKIFLVFFIVLIGGDFLYVGLSALYNYLQAIF